MKTLSKKLSIALHEALDDLEVIEKNDLYLISMEVWHAVDTKHVCEVCLAGCVMANTLKINPILHQSPFDFNTETRRVLESLNGLRTGDILEAFLVTKKLIPNILNYWVVITPYDTDKKLFKADLRALADMLYGQGY